MPYIYRVVLSVIVIFQLVSCGIEQPTNQTNALAGKLIITGSSTIAPLASELAKKFEKLHPSVKVDVQTGGSSRGIADVKRKVSQIGMVSRTLKVSESDLVGHVIAKDGISIIVHKDNPLNSLTSDQVKEIFRGEISHWSSLYGNNEGSNEGNNDKITVINKAEGRSTLEVFLKFFQLKNREIKPDIIIGDNEQGIKLASLNKNAIAYVSIGTAEYSEHLGIKIKTIALDGVEATTANLVNGTFPLSRELNFITQGERSKLALAFLDYSLSPAAFNTIKEFGFVPIEAR